MCEPHKLIYKKKYLYKKHTVNYEKKWKLDKNNSSESHRIDNIEKHANEKKEVYFLII